VAVRVVVEAVPRPVVRGRRHKRHRAVFILAITLKIRKTNPEDPTLGAFVLNLPSSNTSFSGAMFFTYVGCQSENVGIVSGNKTDAGIAGNWSGSLDGVMNTGSYTGSWQAASQSYSGTFTNAGKQFRDLRPASSITLRRMAALKCLPQKN
jgi:hypothetical protein